MIFNTEKYILDHERQGDIPSFRETGKRVMKIVWPSMVECFLVSLVLMFDSIMVSALGNNANMAVTITKQPVFLQISFITAINICITAMIARRKGENNKDGANRAMHIGMQISFVISIILGIVMAVFAKDICYFMQASENTIDYAVTYLRIVSLGFVFNAMRLTINTSQRAIGNTKISMYTNVMANIINIGLNYLLITGKFGFPALGIAGAAYATIIGNGCAMIVSILFILNKKGFLYLDLKKLFKVDLESFRGFMKMYPSALIEQILLRAGFILFALVVNGLGDDNIFVSGVCNDINSLLFTLADGFAIGTSAIVGHRLGERRKDLAIVYARVSMIISVSVAVVVALIVLAIRGSLIDLYSPETAYRKDLAMNIMVILSLTVIPQNIQWVATGVLRGSGDTKFTARSSFISVTLVRPILSFSLCYLTPLGLYGAFIGMLADQMIRCLLNMRRMSSKQWVNISV